MNSYSKRSILLVCLWGVAAAGFLVGTARAVAFRVVEPVAVPTAPSPAALAAVAGLQAPIGGSALPLPSAGHQPIDWEAFQDHITRVEFLWGTPKDDVFFWSSSAAVAKAPELFVVRTFDSPFSHAPATEPVLAHAALRFMNPASGQSWMVALTSVEWNVFVVELDPRTYFGQGLVLEVLAWEPGTSVSDPGTAFFRTPFISL